MERLPASNSPARGRPSLRASAGVATLCGVRCVVRANCSTNSVKSRGSSGRQKKCDAPAIRQAISSSPEETAPITMTRAAGSRLRSKRQSSAPVRSGSCEAMTQSQTDAPLAARNAASESVTRRNWNRPASAALSDREPARSESTNTMRGNRSVEDWFISVPFLNSVRVACGGTPLSAARRHRES
jgi:hypothetical protein